MYYRQQKRIGKDNIVRRSFQRDCQLLAYPRSRTLTWLQIWLLKTRRFIRVSFDDQGSISILSGRISSNSLAKIRVNTRKNQVSPDGLTEAGLVCYSRTEIKGFVLNYQRG